MQNERAVPIIRAEELLEFRISFKPVRIEIANGRNGWAVPFPPTHLVYGLLQAFWGRYLPAAELLRPEIMNQVRLCARKLKAVLSGSYLPPGSNIGVYPVDEPVAMIRGNENSWHECPCGLLSC